MYDLFYIVEVRPQWYNLVVKTTYYCIACGKDLESLKRTIYKYIRRYKTEDRLLNALSGLDDGGRVSSMTYDIRHKDYASGKHLVFNDLVRGAVEQALKDNRQDTPYNRTKKKVRSITPIGVSSSPLAPTNGVRTVGKIRPHKIMRTLT